MATTLDPRDADAVACVAIHSDAQPHVRRGFIRAYTELLRGDERRAKRAATLDGEIVHEAEARVHRELAPGMIAVPRDEMIALIRVAHAAKTTCEPRMYDMLGTKHLAQQLAALAAINPTFAVTA